MALIGFALPFVGSGRAVASALEVAIDGAINLWLVPLAAMMVLVILSVRRGADAMRASRVAVIGLFVGAALPLVYSVRRIAIMATVEATETTWLVGLWVMVVGLCIGGLGALALGRRPRAR
ncbi:MAG: hypothetical protein AAF436_14580 [Myxococcota bacterium]